MKKYITISILLTTALFSCVTKTTTKTSGKGKHKTTTTTEKKVLF